MNVASYCGFSYLNYKQLSQLMDQFKDRSLIILAFPCNQWAQEPSCETDLKEFVRKKKINYPFLGKVNVNGKDSIPLYKFLKSKQSGTFGHAIKWNFTKFLCDRDGQPVKRYGPMARVKVSNVCFHTRPVDFVLLFNTPVRDMQLVRRFRLINGHCCFEIIIELVFVFAGDCWRHREASWFALISRRKIIGKM